ncbi:hypothetical protein CJ030_MR3G028959 [Morella rubra]|uniref:Early nodulin-75 n=1 Tax=Morella rubra TaxID=262757 RepID=A0A6A1W1W9_9ROSI|nr:hypothetical protein CJ030_MR3G028959 [Morella rubra]
MTYTHLLLLFLALVVLTTPSHADYQKPPVPIQKPPPVEKPSPPVYNPPRKGNPPKGEKPPPKVKPPPTLPPKVKPPPTDFCPTRKVHGYKRQRIPPISTHHEAKNDYYQILSSVLLGAVLLSTASLADCDEPPKHEHKPPKGEKPPAKHNPPTPLNHDEKSFPKHKPEHKPPHEQHPGRHLVESYSLEENSPSLDDKPHKGRKPPPKHNPPTTLDKEEKPFPEHKPPTPSDKPSKHEGEKPPPAHKPPHDHHRGHILLESSSFEENSPSLDGKPHKGRKSPPKHKPPTTLDREEKPFQNTSRQNLVMIVNLPGVGAKNHIKSTNFMIHTNHLMIHTTETVQWRVPMTPTSHLES